MENMKYSILTTPINTMSRNGVIYSEKALSQMAEQINSKKTPCTFGFPNDIGKCFDIQFEDKVIGMCNSAKVTEQGLVVEINMLGNNIIPDEMTVGFAINANKTEYGDVIDPHVMRAYTLLKEDSQWKSDN